MGIGNVRLRRLFFLLSLGLSLTVVAMAAYVVRGAWREVHQATAGLESMQELRALLIAGEMAARERRLTDALLGDTMPDESLKRGQLRAARQVADAAFDTLEHVLYSAAESRESTHQAVLLARRHLDEARQS
ncbi:MAG: hypothetical protein JO370_00895, partial [Paucibacter sp.]|nr:hypothetical protein [Roseateles sp.]